MATNEKISVFLFPHQDDEYFVSPFVFKCEGKILCFFLTNGEGNGTPETIRNRESSQVLSRLQVPLESVRFLPNSLKVADLDLQSRLQDLLDWILDETRNLSIGSVYCPAWEGGHPDHDAAFLLGQVLARKYNCELLAYATYTGHGVFYPLFRVMYLQKNSNAIDIFLNIREKIFYSFLFTYYRSQWRSWMGLAPLSLFRVWSKGGYSVSLHSNKEEVRMAHDSKPYYEKRGWSKWTTFLTSTQRFREKYKL